MTFYSKAFAAQVVFLLSLIGPCWATTPCTLATTSVGWTWQNCPGPQANICKMVDLAVADDSQSIQHGCDGTRDTLVCNKYGGGGTCWNNWATALNSDLQQLGFNSAGMYSYRYHSNYPAGGVPYVPTYGLGGYLMENSVHNGFGPYNVKDITYIPSPSGMKCGSTYGAGSAPGSQADPYDPNFQTGATALMAGDFYLGWDFTKASYVVPEEADYMYTMDNCCGSINSHPDGMLVLASSNPMVTTSRNGFSFTDHELYAKQAMEAYLVAKYTTIAAMNTAWGTSYTTFGTSDSGGLSGITSGTYASWGTGTGFLDENGTNLVKSGLSCSGASGNGLQESDSWAPTGHTQIQTDIDGFINSYAGTYASKVRTAWLAACGSVCPPEFMPLYDGPANSTDSAYAGMASSVEGFWIAPPYYSTPTTIAARVQQIINNDGGKPVIFGQYYTADPDSWPNESCSGNYGGDCKSTQAARALRWVQAGQAVLPLKNPSGKYAVVGLSHYGLYDDCTISGSENLGLRTPNDNAYDGSAASTATSSGSCPTTPTALTMPYICLDTNGNYEGLTQNGTTGSSPTFSTTYGAFLTTGSAIFRNEGSYTPYPENDSGHSGNSGNVLLPVAQFQTGNLCDPSSTQTAPAATLMSDVKP